MAERLNDRNKGKLTRYQSAEPLGVVQLDGQRRKIEGEDLQLYFEQSGKR
jgi:hypothetical protein